MGQGRGDIGGGGGAVSGRGGGALSGLADNKICLGIRSALHLLPTCSQILSPFGPPANVAWRAGTTTLYQS